MPKRSNTAMEIRNLTGLPQWETASMLDTSREAIALYETAKRNSLPAHASIYQTLLEVEMLKPENRGIMEAVQLTENGKQQLAKQLHRVARNCRMDALLTQRKMDECLQKLEQTRNRKLLLHCCEKVQANLMEQFKDITGSPITPHQQLWLEQAKKHHGFSGSNDEIFINHKFQQLKYQRLLNEAEAAERLLAELALGPALV